jgi:hypothetical protein
MHSYTNINNIDINNTIVLPPRNGLKLPKLPRVCNRMDCMRLLANKGCRTVGDFRTTISLPPPPVVDILNLFRSGSIVLTLG